VLVSLAEWVIDLNILSDTCNSTMYFAGKKEIVHNNWEHTGSSIDCSTTSSCANQHAKMENNCDTNTWNVGYGAGATFFEAVSLDFKFENGGSKQTCKMEQTSSTCTWDPELDKKNGRSTCHAIWKASSQTKVSGYMSRVCRFTKSGTQRPFGSINMEQQLTCIHYRRSSFHRSRTKIASYKHGIRQGLSLPCRYHGLGHHHA
jgi:hypothetical protein